MGQKKKKKRVPLTPPIFGLLLELQALADIPIAIISLPNAEAAESFHACLAFYSIYTWTASAFLSLQ